MCIFCACRIKAQRQRAVFVSWIRLLLMATLLYEVTFSINYVDGTTFDAARHSISCSHIDLIHRLCACMGSHVEIIMLSQLHPRGQSPSNELAQQNNAEFRVGGADHCELFSVLHFCLV